jgi:hypothetical protein
MSTPATVPVGARQQLRTALAHLREEPFAHVVERLTRRLDIGTNAQGVCCQERSDAPDRPGQHRGSGSGASGRQGLFVVHRTLRSRAGPRRGANTASNHANTSNDT